jgi:signal transduction histidine kinase
MMRPKLTLSIRLRLTLLYSAILALTLITFSTILYLTQSQVTFDAIQTSLARQAQELAIRERRSPRRPADTPATILPMPGRWTQIRSPDGTVIARSSDLGDASLPLSTTGLQAVQNGTVWVERARLDNDPLLVYNQPVVSQSQVTAIVQVAASTAEREQALATLRLILIAGSLVVILAAFAVGWALAGAALRPIDRITHTAQAIGAERNFGRRVDHAGPNDEVGQLAVTFNGMLTELETAYRQVEQALQAQRRFVADASHELRTPLTTVRGNIDLLRHETPMDPKERADVLADTKAEVERLIRLVNQLLVLARADAGRPLQVKPLRIKPLVEDVYRQTKNLAPQKSIVYDPVPDATALGDRDALKQVLLILLDNAVVHTPPSASIRISGEAQDHHIVINVQDTGPGIAPNLLPHIFERFFRGSASRSGGGTGLGLSIAKELAQAQQGTLVVESRSGQGTTFTLTLQAAP